jgi:hypothetical protein
VVHTVRVIRDEVVASVDAALPVPDAIRAYIRTVASIRRRRPEAFRALDRITSQLQDSDGTPAFSQQDYEELYLGQEALFRRGQAEGAFRDFDTRVMAVTYQAAVDAMLTYLDVNPEVDVDRYAEALADILLGAMRRRPGSARQRR